MHVSPPSLSIPPLPPAPMLATAGPPPTSTGWIAEAKYDGARAMSRVCAGRTEIFSRPGNRLTRRFPEIIDALASVLAGHSTILDGEIVATDSSGRPDFTRLQRRLRVSSPTPTLQAAVSAKLLVFDVIHIDGVDLTRRPYHERRAALDDLALPDGPVMVPPVWPDLDSAILLDVVKQMRLEGAVFKRANSTYQSGRSRSWIKHVIRQQAAVVIAGWIPGRADPVGALLLGAHDATGALVYVGSVTSGLSRTARRSLYSRLSALETPSSPFSRDRQRSAAHGVRWVKPQLVGVVEHREFSGNKFRHPAWKGLLSADPDAVSLPAVE
jgi:bifunctional non-homologous end joining protein LigD